MVTEYDIDNLLPALLSVSVTYVVMSSILLEISFSNNGRRLEDLSLMV